MDLWIVVVAVIVLVMIVIIAPRILLARLLRRRLVVIQNDLMEKHVDEVHNIYRQMRGWRHDYHNHIQTMKAHLALQQLTELQEYMNRLDQDLTSVDTILKTGNIMLDAILNSKISLASSKDIRINAKAMAPETMTISPIDLCVIIGNLLDNATEACMKIAEPERRFIRVYIGLMKEQFYISVSNAMEGDAKKTGRRYFTSKGEGHGFGLMRVDQIASRYGGFVNRQHEEGVFATEIMLPL